MNWISLLFPKPHFEVTWGPQWMRRVHGIALTLAYYFSHVLTLLGLTLIYLVVILPLSLFFVRKDLLKFKWDKHTSSYLETTDLSHQTDFKRMY